MLRQTNVVVVVVSPSHALLTGVVKTAKTPLESF
jgi:hypothetical protein